MQQSRSPPKFSHSTDMGGSTTETAALCNIKPTKNSSSSQLSNIASMKNKLDNNTNASFGSNSTLISNSSKSRLLASSTENLMKPNYYMHSHAHSHDHQHHNYHYHHAHSSNGFNSGGSGSVRSMSSTGKRGRKRNWGTRERTGMSFLIVIAFFAVFGLIILTEFFMIDERSHSAMVMLRHGGGSYAGRLGDSMPDYDNVKDDYDVLDESLLGDNKLGFVQFRDNKLKIQDAGTNDAGRLAGILLNSGGVNGYGMGMGIGASGGVFNVPQIPWGKVLPTKIEETLPSYPIGMTPTSGSWQVVNGTRFKFFVFSAYYDRRDGAKLVRIIGATKTRGPERVWCRFWYLNRNASINAAENARHRYTSVTVMARVKIIRENFNLKYSACFILCPIRGRDVEVPQFVSIVSRLRTPPGNLLILKNTDWDEDFMHLLGNHNMSNSIVSAKVVGSVSSIPTGDQIADKIAVCVKPFHFNYDQALYLIEYLEFYTLLGVSHFTFYNHTIGPHASCVLQHYIDGDVPDKLTAIDEKNESANNNNSSNNNPKNGKTKKAQTLKSHYTIPTINILPWDLRMLSQKEIRTEGLFAALNDCVYRNMYRYKYLALVDLDEFIVPRHNNTLNDLISSLNSRFLNRNIGAYSFQNAFFYLQFPDDSSVYQSTKNDIDSRMRAALVTQRKTKRRLKLHPQKQRSKYICKPESVVEAGNHFVWEFSSGKGSLNVAPNEAILQHYRVCEFGGNDCIKAPSVVDRTATRYVNRLVQRVLPVYQYLKKSCDLPDLPNLYKQITKTVTDNNNNNEQEHENKEKFSKTYTGINSNEQFNSVAVSPNLTTSNKYKKSKELNKITITTDSVPTIAKTNKMATIKNSENLSTAEKKILLESKQKNQLQQHKRKIIVFEHDANGLPRARVKYV